MEELHDDIQRYLRLEEFQVNIDFWTVSKCISGTNVSSMNSQNMMVVCKDRLETLRNDAGQYGRRGHLVNPEVQSSIVNLLSGKSYDQLQKLQRDIQAKLNSGDPIDTDYWEGLLKNLVVWKAKVCGLCCEADIIYSAKYRPN